MAATFIRGLTFLFVALGLVVFFWAGRPAWWGFTLVFVCFFGLSVANVFEKGN